MIGQSATALPLPMQKACLSSYLSLSLTLYMRIIIGLREMGPAYILKAIWYSISQTKWVYSIYNIVKGEMGVAEIFS